MRIFVKTSVQKALLHSCGMPCIVPLFLAQKDFVAKSRSHVTNNVWSFKYHCSYRGSISFWNVSLVRKERFVEFDLFPDSFQSNHKFCSEIKGFIYIKWGKSVYVLLNERYFFPPTLLNVSIVYKLELCFGKTSSMFRQELIHFIELQWNQQLFLMKKTISRLKWPLCQVWTFILDTESNVSELQLCSWEI